MSRTKIIGAIIILIAILKCAVDYYDGGTFMLDQHIREIVNAVDNLLVALGGAGWIFMRSGITKEIENAKKEIRTSAPAKRS